MTMPGAAIGTILDSSSALDRRFSAGLAPAARMLPAIASNPESSDEETSCAGFG
jgi:hypothetical protein